jgi:ferritin-like protein
MLECCCCCGTSNVENTGCCEPGTPLPSITYAELQCLGLDGMSPEEYMQYTDMLKQALAEEFKAWYQYHIVIPFLEGEEGTDAIKKLFIELADDELNHHATEIMQLMKRINIVPVCLFPGCWDNYIPFKHRSDIFSGCTLENVINNITLETGAIDTYVKLVKFTKDKDPEGHDLFKEILADEEEHLAKLQTIMNKYFVK